MPLGRWPGSIFHFSAPANVVQLRIATDLREAAAVTGIVSLGAAPQERAPFLRIWDKPAAVWSLGSPDSRGHDHTDAAASCALIIVRFLF